MKALIVAIVLAFGVLLLWLAKPAHAAPCGSHDLIHAALAKKYNEVPVFIGLAGDRIIEVYASPAGDTFTFLSSDVHGLTCIFVTGTDWSPAKPEIPGEKL